MEKIQSQNSTIPSLENLQRKWYFFDLKDKKIGKLAPMIADLLRGKRNKDFLPNLDMGNFVVLVNAKFTAFSGKKIEKNKKYNHSGYPGGLRTRTWAEMLDKSPVELVQRIVKGMMPSNKLSRHQIKRLFIYPEDKHRLKAQEKNFLIEN